MTVCSFFLQGRCRYGDKCRYEHPRGGGGQHSRPSGQQQPRGGGFGNRVWVNPEHQKRGYIQPASFSSHGGDDWGRDGHGGADWGRGGGGRNDWGRGGGGRNDWGRGGGGGNDWGKGGGGGNDWGRGGGGGNDWGRGGGGGNDWSRGERGGRRENVRSSEFSFSTSNRFSTFDNNSSFNRERRGGETAGDEDDDVKLEIIQKDMEIWETSHQWCFSCYSCSKAPLSGFTDVSPEELRLEYYSKRASGDLQDYINGVNQLLNQWRSRVQELRVMIPATRTALLGELQNPAPQASSGAFGSVTATGFGFPTSDFGSKGPVQASNFAATTGGFGSSSSSAGFGGATTASTQPPSGFGSSSAASASSFSFTAPSSNKPVTASGFGSASGFSFSSAANSVGEGFGAPASAAPGSSSTFGQIKGGFGTNAAPAAAGSGSVGGASDSLFTPESKLTPEELNQFKSKRFTLGHIPLKPPPSDMLVV